MYIEFIRMSTMLYNIFVKNIENRNPLGENLIRLRKKHGLTQEELASSAGISRRMLAHYETKVTKPSLEKIEALSKALNVTIEQLSGYQKADSKIENDFSNIDSRTLKKFKQVLSLSTAERHMVYSFIDSLIGNKKQKRGA
jgi:transcriptional regulator with XRE-family HTH domain